MTIKPTKGRALGLLIAASTTAAGLSACGSSSSAATPAKTSSPQSSTAATAASCNTTGRHPGISSSQILLGVSAPQTGTGAADWGSVVGEEAYFKYINAQGGVKGRKIKLKALNDQYTSSMNIDNVRQLIESDKVFALAGGNGTANTLASIPLIVQSGIPDIGPNAPSNTLGTMKTPNVYLMTSNYTQQFEVLTKYVADHYHPTSYSLVGVTGDVDKSALAGMKAVLGSSVTINNIPETPGTANMAPLASQLQRYNAPWVFFIITDPDTGNLLEAMQRIGYAPKTASWSGMTDPVNFIAPYHSVSQGLIAIEPQLPPTANSVGTQNSNLYKSVTGTDPNPFNELGWVQGMLTVEALKNAKALTWSCVKTALNQVNNLSAGFYPPISFGASNRQGTTAVALAQIKGTSLVQLKGFVSASAG